MKTQTPATAESSDSTFPHINGINMEVAVELLGQEIAKRAAAIEAEERAGDHRRRVGELKAEMTELRRRQQSLRSENTFDVQAVFDEFGTKAGRS